MKQTTLRGGVAAAVLALLSGFFMPLAQAAEPAGQNPDGAFNMVISPSSIGLEVQPGKTVSTDLKLQNQGLSSEKVKVSVMKFGAEGQDGTPAIKDLEPADEFAKWIQFSETNFTAESRVWKTIKVTISPPANAAFGYYYAVVFTRDQANQPVQPEVANLRGAVAGLILLDVKSPNAVRKTSIAEFSTPNKVQEFLPVNFTVRMRNTGNVHVAPRGNIVISKGGKTIGLIEVNLKKGSILPDTYRKFDASWNDGRPVYQQKTEGGKVVLNDKNLPVKSLNWDGVGPGKLRFGKYEAKLVMVYDDGKGDVSAEATLSFWVIPWRVLFVSLLVVLLILAGLWATVLRPVRARFKAKRWRGGNR